MQKEGNEFWSTKHLISKEEYIKIDSWFYENLFFNNQYELKLSNFEEEIEIFKKELVGERFIDFILYSEEASFSIRPEKLDEIIKESLEVHGASLNANWFTAYQSHTYKHDVGVVGIYTFKRGKNKNRNGGLYPVLSNLANEKIGQDIRSNYGLFSGLIGEDKDWILLYSILNENEKEISIRVGGTKQFCLTIEEKIEK